MAGSEEPKTAVQGRQPWTPSRPALPKRSEPTVLPVSQIRFSQNTVGPSTYLNGVKIALVRLVALMRSRNHYPCLPIDVVRLPDGKLTSLDNRRLLAARRAGLKGIPAILHDGSEPLPPGEGLRFRMKKRIVDRHGDLGPAGTELIALKASAETYFEAVVVRCAAQGKTRTGQRFTLSGVDEEPRVSNDAAQRPVTVNGTPSPESAVQNGQTPGRIVLSKNPLGPTQRPVRRPKGLGGVER